MITISYTDDLTGITPSDLVGYFIGWPNPPSEHTLLDLLQASKHRCIAREDTTKRIVGYITALSDGVLFGYISSVEVLPDYQKLGIGKELVRRILAEMGHLYAVDLVCDLDVQPFYERCGMQPWSAMIIRRRESENI